MRARAALIAIGVLIAGLVSAPAARAETAYRYWSYWQVREGAWSFATVGPATSMPEDGDVEGWRFVVTTAQGTPADAPQRPAAAAFEEICGGTPGEAGRKRVALVVDFGSAADAPGGETPPAALAECVVAGADASGAQVLSAMADVRAEDGLVCGIAGYPTVACPEVVDTATAVVAAAAPATEVTEDAPVGAAPGVGGAPALLISGALLLIAAAIGATVWRRRSA